MIIISHNIRLFPFDMVSVVRPCAHVIYYDMLMNRVPVCVCVYAYLPIAAQFNAEPHHPSEMKTTVDSSGEGHCHCWPFSRSKK